MIHNKKGGENSPDQGETPLARALRATFEHGQVQRAIISQRAQAHDLNIVDLEVIIIVGQQHAQAERSSPSGVSRRMGLSASTMTAVLDRLEHRALLQRQKDPDDRRRFFLIPTESALTIIDGLTEELRQCYEPALLRFDDEQLHTINEYLRIINTVACGAAGFDGNWHDEPGRDEG